MRSAHVSKLAILVLKALCARKSEKHDQFGRCQARDSTLEQEIQKLNCNILIPVECLELIIHEMFWTHWNLSPLWSFYGLAASGSETEYTGCF
jgi:hypothetical protein